MPALHDEIVHKALSSDVRRKILLSLAKGDKYLTQISKEIKKKPQTLDFHLKLLEEIGLVESEWRKGKKFYYITEKKVIDFLRKRRPIPERFHHKPPHEIVIDAWEDLSVRMDRIERKLDKLSRKKKR